MVHNICWYDQMARIFSKMSYFRYAEDFDVHIHCKFDVHIRSGIKAKSDGSH